MQHIEPMGWVGLLTSIVFVGLAMVVYQAAAVLLIWRVGVPKAEGRAGLSQANKWFRILLTILVVAGPWIYHFRGLLYTPPRITIWPYG